MQFRNNNENVPATISVAMSTPRTKKVNPVTGLEYIPDVIPQIHTVHIPALATVEIDDEIWLKAWSAKTTIPLYETTKEKVETGGKEEFHTILNMPLGTTKVVYPLREQVKKGEFTIVVPPKSTLTDAQMKKALTEMGIPLDKDITKEQIENLYNKLVD